MDTVTIHVAKTTLSKLLRRVEAGEEIILARGKRPVARLLPSEPPRPQRQFGVLKGTVSVDPSFFDSLPQDELDAWDQ